MSAQKKLLLRKNFTLNKSFYNYETKAFKRFDVETGDWNRSNVVDLKIKMTQEMILEIKNQIRKGNKLLEIRQKELFLKDKHQAEVLEKMAEIHSVTMSDDFKQTALDEGYSDEVTEQEYIDAESDKVQEFVRENHFLKYKENLFESNLDGVFIRYNHTKKEMYMYYIKSFKNGSNRMFVHKVNNHIVKAFRKLVLA